MGLGRTVRGFVHLGRRDQFRLVAAWSLLGFCRLLILVVPFRVVRRLLGDHEGTGAASRAAPAAERPLTAQDSARARRIGVVVDAAAEHTPWKSECYPRALTARAFLVARRIPHRVCFGVRRDGSALVAHAWVVAGDSTVTGATTKVYAEVGSFAWNPR
ncbi:lasso peptide biosynthesis B2 protein [Marmoricola sp. RAF53]|uniref:lasso peptide biosynthesis B2 protein n=1 Tax=Marmoricola sp. RAF53 TaxID=3233059 RepID=UPI003F96368B